MKHILVIIISIITVSVSAQMVIPVSYYKNVNLIFNSNIIDDDVSNPDNIKIEHDANILKVQAKGKPFNFETSISVLTEDNIFYTFLIKYDEKLTQLTYLVPDSIGIEIPNTRQNPDDFIETKSGDLESKQLDKLCELVYASEPIFTEKGYTYKNITIELAGIWVNNDILFFKLLMSNETNIPYDISSTNLYIKERKRMRKTSTDPIEKEPFYHYGDNEIPAKSENNIYIMVFEKFTIAHDKRLLLEVVEKDGGRKVEFEIVKDLIIRAPVIN